MKPCRVVHFQQFCDAHLMSTSVDDARPDRASGTRPERHTASAADRVSGDLFAQLEVAEKYGRDRPWELKCRAAQRMF
jgi:hypothetical protein